MNNIHIIKLTDGPSLDADPKLETRDEEAITLGGNPDSSVECNSLDPSSSPQGKQA